MKHQVFVLDDELEVCELITEICELQDFEANYSISSADFRQQLQTHLQIDIIFLDLNMPGKDGIEIIRELADMEYPGHVILMSGFDDSVLSTAGELAAEFGLKILPSIHKPFTIETVFNVLSQFKEQNKNSNKSQIKANNPNTGFSCDNIQRWLENDHVIMHFQPQIEMATNNVIGLEALVRLQDDDGITIYPGDFIPTVEANGLNNLLLSKVVEAVCRDYETHCAFLNYLNISINVSALDLNQLTFPDELYNRIAKSKLKSSQITIEITESKAIDQLRTGLDILARLRLKGFHLSIDDFGTGEAVLGHIRQMPYNELKIDKSFIDHVTSNQRTYSLTKDLINMAQHLGLKIVAEGIEDLDTSNALKDMGCEIAQGYYYAKPMPINQLISWIQNR